MKIDLALVSIEIFGWFYKETFCRKCIDEREALEQRWILVIARAEDDIVVVLWPDVSVSICSYDVHWDMHSRNP